MDIYKSLPLKNETHRNIVHIESHIDKLELEGIDPSCPLFTRFYPFGQWFVEEAVV